MLKSKWFRDNERLRKCLLSDPAHVLSGDRGDYVYLIQGALQTLDYALISPQELIETKYGDSTAKAVLRYKTKRQIVNFSYQQAPDNIVGRMTMRSLDDEMFTLEGRYSRLLLAFAVPSPSGVVVVQSQPFASAWANQFVSANQPTWQKRQSPAGGPKQVVEGLAKVIKEVGNQGMMIFAVGHGISGALPTQGGFDLADNDLLRIGGLGSYTDLKVFVDVYYDIVDHNSGSPHSPMENDELTQNAGAKRRLENWGLWLKLCQAFRNTHLSVVILLTCNIGNNQEFLKKVAILWNTPIVAYKTYISFEGSVQGQQRARAVLDRDVNTHSGTDTPFAETHIPMSQPDIVIVSPWK